jgi:hypothetical protein
MNISRTTQQKTLTPEDVQVTSDGGSILLASTDCTTQACVSAQGGTNSLVTWLVKADSSGNPQRQKELGCFSSPPGDYSIGVSVQQTTDGGLLWQRTVGPAGSTTASFNAIQQTSDAGYVATG